MTLGLVLNGRGFPRQSQIFPGNVSEPATLETMLKALGGHAGSTVVMDAGIASEANVQWLVKHGFHYLVVSRQRHRAFDEDSAVIVKDEPGQTIRVQRVVLEETQEVLLYCH